jgi:uncharacterized protein (TIGR03545 family)
VRKKGIIGVIVFILFVLILAYFFSDDWLEGQIETYASDIVGAKVEIDNFDLNLAELNAGWSRLQVTDPNDTWRNIIETGNAKFNIAAEPLLYKRWIVEELRLEDFRSGSKRETDGKLPEGRLNSDEPTVLDKTIESLKNNLSQTVGFDITKIDQQVNVDSVIKILELQTPAKVETFQKEIQITISLWQTETNSLSNLDNHAKDMIADLQTIKVDQLKNLDEITSAVAKVTTFRDQIDSLHKSIIAKRSAFKNDWSNLSSQVRLVDDWIKEDIQRAVNKAKLPDFSVENIAKMLFGESLIPKLETGLKYFNLAQKYGKKLAPTGKVESPPRFKGQDILFPDKRKMPKFWLKEMVVSGETGSSLEDRGLMLAGSILNLTTNPKTVGKPTEINLSSKKENKISYDFSGILDRVQEAAKDKFSVAVSNVSLNNAELGGSGFLPNKISKGNMNVKFDLNLLQGALEGKLDIKTQQVSFLFSENSKNDQFTKIVQDVLSSIDKINVNLDFSGKPDQLKVNLKSNLDNVFASKFKSLVSGQVAKGKAELERRVRAKLEPRKRQVLAVYNQKRQELETKVTDLENQINEKVQFIENKKKEIEKRFEDEKKKQTDDLKKKAEDKLRSLLKKKK